MLRKIKKGVVGMYTGLFVLGTGCNSYDPLPGPRVRWTPRYVFAEIYLGRDTTPVPLNQYIGGAYTLIVKQPRKGVVARRYHSYTRESIPSYIPPATYRAVPDSRDYQSFDTIPYQLVWDSAGVPMELKSQIIVKARPSL